MMAHARCLPILTAAVLLAAAPASAQNARDLRDHQTIADSAAVAELARDLTAAAGTAQERAQAIYEWVARHIAYDAPSLMAGRTPPQTAEAIYRTGLGLCAGYVALYQRMALEVGLPTERIGGYAKGFGYVNGQSTEEENHAWLAVRVEGGWGLVDPTWGAGVVRDGVFEPAFSWDYFLIAPEELLLSHFPEKASWQLVGRRLARRDFERMPAVPRPLIQVGFSAEAIRAALLAGSVRDFPLVGPHGGARVISAPLAGRVRSDAAVEVELVWVGALEVVLVRGDAWTPLERDGDRFRGRAGPGPGPVWVLGRTGDATTAYMTLLHYAVE
jgi:hypothetical protein